MATGFERPKGGSADREYAQWAGKPLPPAELLAFAARRSGRGVVDIAREMWRLRRGPGQLRMKEYVQYGLYDNSRFTPAQKAEFLSNLEHWKIAAACCDMSWQATTEDKWLTSHILGPTSIPVPRTLGVIDKGHRSYPGTSVFRTLDDLRGYLLHDAEFPLFGKVNRGMVSFGAFLMLAADEDGVDLKGEGRLPWASFWDDFLGQNAYLLQPVVRNHAFFAPLAEGLATLRMVVLVTPEEVRVPIAVLDLPASGAVANTFWRKGNIGCDVDVATGVIRNICTLDQLEVHRHEAHPENGAEMIGLTLPLWEETLDMVRRCAMIFAPVRYQSMDVAITDAGPVLIEINTGGGFALPQQVTGKGLLTPEIRAFFESCGWKFK